VSLAAGQEDTHTSNDTPKLPVVGSVCRRVESLIGDAAVWSDSNAAVEPAMPMLRMSRRRCASLFAPTLQDNPDYNQLQCKLGHTPQDYLPAPEKETVQHCDVRASMLRQVPGDAGLGGLENRLQARSCAARQTCHIHVM
jgi:hypothetical protein